MHGTLGLTARIIPVRKPSDLDTAFATGKRENLQALLIGNDPFFVSHREEVTNLAAKARLPTMYGIREFVLVGGLMSYGTNLAELYRDKARLVDKILKGASAGDLPIERPTKFEFLINLKAVKALNLALPPHFLRPQMRCLNSRQLGRPDVRYSHLADIGRTLPEGLCVPFQYSTLSRYNYIPERRG